MGEKVYRRPCFVCLSEVIFHEGEVPICTECGATRCPSCGAISIMPTYTEEGDPIGRCTNPGCMMVVRLDKNTPTIMVRGSKAEEVQEVSLALIEKAKPQPLPLRPSPWASGSFYLVVFMAVLITLLVAGKILPPFILPIVVIGGILALSVIGAFQMRHDERLSEGNFLKLMALSFKYLPWIRRRDEKF